MANEVERSEFVRLTAMLIDAELVAKTLADDRGIGALLTRCLIRASPSYLEVRTRLN